MIDNISIAIFVKVNELADRHGLKPYEFVAAIHEHAEGDKLILRYDVPVSGDPTKEARFGKMLDQLGVSDTSHDLAGTDQQIIDALDHALHLAPRRRPRT